VSKEIAQLCKYYLDCLANTRDDFSFIIKNTEDERNYIISKNLNLLEKEYILKVGDANWATIDKLVKLNNKDKNSTDIYYGYPFYFKKKKSFNRLFELKATPIVYFNIEITDNYRIKVNIENPILNKSAFKLSKNTSDYESIQEFVDVEKHLAKLSLSEYKIYFTELFERTKSYWNYRNQFDFDYLDKPNIDFNNVNYGGVYNKAMIFIGDKSNFTKGLESELLLLSQKEDSAFEGTALYNLFFGLDEEEKNNSFSINPYTNLNDEQRQAVENSLSRNLTIIQGPPGTGKSQVVTNILINAVENNQKVIFTSKNNQAVNVVKERTNNLAGKKPFLLRLGKDTDNNFDEYCSSLLSTTFNRNEEIEFENLIKNREAIKSTLGNRTKIIHSLMSQRNQLDSIDSEIDEIKMNSKTKIEVLHRLDVNYYKEMYEKLERTILKLQKIKLSLIEKLLWFYYRKSYQNELEQIMNQLRKIFKRDSISYEESISNNLEYSKNILNVLHKTINNSIKVKEYFSVYSKLVSQSIEKEYISVYTDKSNIIESSKTIFKLYNKRRIKDVPDNYFKQIKEFLNSRDWRRKSIIQTRLLDIFKAVSITSLSAQKIPFTKNYFDLLIIDEASQCDVASTIPLLYRAKRVVIIGDSKQLNHIDNLKSEVDNELINKYKIDQIDWSFKKSLLELAVTLINPVKSINLRNHYRSDPQIINFSNYQFYFDELRILTKLDGLNKIDFFKPFNWIEVKGKSVRPPYGSLINKYEVEEVYKILKEIVLGHKYHGSIGIVSAYREQTNEIKKRINNDDELNLALNSLDFTVDTIHKFQGDEKDIIIFSTVLSQNNYENLTFFYMNNPNLFNVAITRARAHLFVVGDREYLVNTGIEYLKNFVEYSFQIEGEKDAKSKVNELRNYPIIMDDSVVSEWERLFYLKLKEAKINAIPQYPVDLYKLDFALFDGERKLNVEIDGEMYHKNWDNEYLRRDQLRNERLVELGWEVKRFWVYQLKYDLEKCIQEVSNWLNS
jgi:very-short-patch-repair endonuclease